MEVHDVALDPATVVVAGDQQVCVYFYTTLIDYKININLGPC